jgi:putative membrane protein
MYQDALLAIVHHVAVFSIAAILFAEWTLLRPGITPTQLRLVSRMDSAYGMFAMLALVIGFSRAVYGAKGWAFYAGNPVFWAKIAVFAIIGGLSAVPTIALIRWKRAGAPTDGQVQSLRVWLNAEVALFLLLPTLAALMARGIGH